MLIVIAHIVVNVSATSPPAMSLHLHTPYLLCLHLAALSLEGCGGGEGLADF